MTQIDIAALVADLTGPIPVIEGLSGPYPDETAIRDTADQAVAAIIAQDAELKRLRDALKPFAAVADYMDEDTGGFDPEDEFVLIYKAMIESGDTSWSAGTFLLRHFYEARAALGEKP